MSRRDQLRAIIDRIPDDRLDELLAVARGFDPPAEQPAGGPASFLRTARGLRIDAPPDFASNLDEYLYGGRDIDAG